MQKTTSMTAFSNLNNLKFFYQFLYPHRTYQKRTIIKRKFPQFLGPNLILIEHP